MSDVLGGNSSVAVVPEINAQVSSGPAVKQWAFNASGFFFDGVMRPGR
jgi:hypothetical protein